MDEAIEKAILMLAIDKPAFGQVRVSNELKKQGLFVSPGGVRSVWLRHDLEVFGKRLKALEAKEAVSAVHRHYGGIDGLVNNAGRSYAAAVEEIDPAVFDEIFHLNVLGPIVAMHRL